MATQLYRQGTLGKALEEALDELVQSGAITPQAAMRATEHFDKSVVENLGKATSTATMKGGLLSYRYVNSVLTLNMRDVAFDFKERGRGSQSVDSGSLKVVACDASFFDGDSAPQKGASKPRSRPK